MNVIGSLVLGGLVGAGERVPYAWSLLLGSGPCGALTTYSTFWFESWRLVEERRLASALGNALGTVVLCVAAAASGFVLVQGVVGGTG
ncbi:MAG TPA: CrcB family protein [Dermatophilaceae bacterium]|nr:CrcB family protein [Dermatophilaceae bacterium]